jgi:Leucine-rich repeat (LRR) protein
MQTGGEAKRVKHGGAGRGPQDGSLQEQLIRACLADGAPLEKEMLLAQYLTSRDLRHLSRTARWLRPYCYQVDKLHLHPPRHRDDDIASMLARHRRVTHLELRTCVGAGWCLAALNTITSLTIRIVTEEGQEAFVRALREGACPGLRSLRFKQAENTAAEDALIGLAEAWGTGGVSRQLRRLELGFLGIGLRGLRPLGRAMSKLSHLEELELSFNTGILPMLRALQPGACRRLRVLTLDSTDTCWEACQELARVVRRGDLPRLERLDLRNNYNITAEGVEALAAAWRDEEEPPRLRELRLYGTTIGSEGCRALATAVSAGKLPRLEVLDLGHVMVDEMAFDNGGVRALGEALERGGCPRLRELNLTWNATALDGCRALAKAMRAGALPALERLDLSQNDTVGDEAARELAEGLEGGAVPRLRELVLSGNVIGRRARDRLQEAADRAGLGVRLLFGDRDER